MGYPKKKAMMATWDDIDSSSSKKDEKHVANLCLMADSHKDQVFDFGSVSDFSNHKKLEQVFDNLLNESHILILKCTNLKEQLSNAQRENEKLGVDNENLFKRNHCLQESHFKLSEQLRVGREATTKRIISFDQTKLENENKVLKENVEKLSKYLANFVAGTTNLDKLVGV